MYLEASYLPALLFISQPFAKTTLANKERIKMIMSGLAMDDISDDIQNIPPFSFH